VRLQVAGTGGPDVGKGIARVGGKSMEELGIREGQVIEIEGKGVTAAVALPPIPEDEGLEIIRLDGLQRANAGVGIGDHVEIRPAEMQPARKITLAPAQKNIRLSGSAEALRRTLLQRPLMAGDFISTAVYGRGDRRASSEVPDDIFRAFFGQPSFGLQEIRLVGFTPPAERAEV